MRRRRHWPKPPLPPEGWMWFNVRGRDQLVPIAEVERSFQRTMEAWDALPRSDKRYLLDGALPGDYPHLGI